MTVQELVRACGFKEITLPDPDREINGVYIGDLLSWVMGNAESSNIWITIMCNINMGAVATLVETSCILLAEDVVLEAEVLETAKAKGVNILSTDLSAYDAAIKIFGAF